MIRGMITALVILSVFFGCTKSEEKLRRSFVPIAILQSKEIEKEIRARYRGEDDSCKQTGNDSFFQFFIKCPDAVQYDIRKTDSIVTPYVGTVTVKCVRYTRWARTESECERAPFEKKVLTGTAFYVYKNKEWVLKE